MDQSRQRVVILGSTGSVGVSTLEVLQRHPQRFEVFALTAHTRTSQLLQQCVEVRPAFAVMATAEFGVLLQQQCRDLGLPTRVLWGEEALCTVAAHEQADIVMAAVVGAAGLAPCLAAARAGKRLLLANKEALVVGAGLFLQAVAQGGATLLPIDSEHSAVFQCLPPQRASWPTCIDKIILTASGGPFRSRDPRTFHLVTPQEACAHPNWVMGRKISVDSATMMNKALELIEAHYLFGVSVQQLEVVIHPQSVIHSMVQYRDHSVLAQLGTPDMRVPIAYGLSWPDRIESGATALDFRTLADLTFEPSDSPQQRERFPGLQLAWSVLRAPPGSTAVLNASNEVAVAAFLDGCIRFDEIHRVNDATMNSLVPPAPGSLADLLELDAQARAHARQTVQSLKT